LIFRRYLPRKQLKRGGANTPPFFIELFFKCDYYIFVRKILYTFAIFSAFFILSPRDTLSIDISVNPVRVFFSVGQKANIIKVENNSDEKVALQLTVFSWSQDTEGENVYEPTEELIFFPKIFNLDKKEERIIRVGKRVQPGQTEKTYRIFLEEIPGPQAAPLEATELRTILRIGVPVFIVPVKTSVAGEIGDIELEKGKLSIPVKNTGNVHFVVRTVKVEGMDAEGATVLQREIAGWYLLQGWGKTFSMEIPGESCPDIDSLKIDVITDRLSMNKRHDVSDEMCYP
jgi:fimbrial chaperone protein